MRVDGAVVARVLGVVDALHQLGAREGAAGLAGQRGQQVELGGRQVDRRATPAHDPALQVDGQGPACSAPL